MLWFERLYAWLGLPLWAGAILIGTLPSFIAVMLSGYFSGVAVPRSFYYLDASTFVIIVYLQLGSSYIRKSLEKSIEYARSLSQDKQHLERNFNPLYELKYVLLCWVLVEAIFAYLFYVPSSGAPFALARSPFFLALGVAGNAYFTFIEATMLWVFVYSMYSLYKIGKMPLNLRPFTEDRTLGLRPFGSASLRNATVFIGFMVIIVIALTLVSQVDTPAITAVNVASFLAGFALFLFPLVSFRKKLREAKAGLLSTLAPRYTDIVQKLIKSSPEDPLLSDSIKNDYNTMRNLLQDVGQIHSWPFDIGIATRLSSTILIPLFLTVFGRELIIQFLHV